MLHSFIVNEPISFYQSIYVNYYCKAPIFTFDGIAVFFKKETFAHAFYESQNRKAKDKSIFSYRRANRIYWIEWVLQNAHAELYKGYDSIKKRVDDSRRLALCVDTYVVVIELNKKKTKAEFITAYIADGVNGRGQQAIDLIRGGDKW